MFERNWKLLLLSHWFISVQHSLFSWEIRWKVWEQFLLRQPPLGYFVENSGDVFCSFSYRRRLNLLLLDYLALPSLFIEHIRKLFFSVTCKSWSEHHCGSYPVWSQLSNIWSNCMWSPQPEPSGSSCLFLFPSMSLLLYIVQVYHMTIVEYSMSGGRGESPSSWLQCYFRWQNSCNS